ncbi:MAG: T9SS type A sorting domain-containing protein [Flavobacteriales bacterium]|nr:T9SS type A sorting domain-containing protein [Flavobacteriales bacterium]
MHTRYSFRNHPARQRWRLGLATLACTGLLASASAQTANLYSFSTSTGASLEDMSGATTLLGANQDYASVVGVNIGFSFSFEGTAYTQFSINENGNMQLGSGNVGGGQVYNPSNASAAQLLPFSMDVSTWANGAVTTKLSGTTPDQLRIVQWYVGTATSANTTFQMILAEGTNTVEFRYAAGVADGLDNFVGIFGSNPSQYLNVRPGPVGSSTNAAALNQWPGSGRSFLFTPPAPCTPPPAPGNTLASVTSGCPGVTANLSLQNSTSGSGVSYQWQSSPDGMAPWTNVSSTTVTYMTSALVATTWFRCEVTCSVGASTVASNPVQITVSSPAPSYQVFSGTQITESFASWGNRCSTTDVPSSASNFWTNSPAYGPGSWRRNDQGASAGWNNISGYSYSDANGAVAPAARFHSRQGGSVVGTLDYHVNMIAGSGAELLRFEYINSSNGILEVLVSQDGGSNFTSLGTPLNYVGGSVWSTKEYTIGSTSAQTVIRLKGTAGAPASGNDIGVDNFRIIPVASCVKPLAVGATISGPGTVDVNWTCTACAGSYIIEYGTTGFAPGTGATAGGGTMVTSASSPVSIPGIANGNFQLYVRQDCGSGSYSENSAPVAFSVVAGDFCSNAINLTTLPLTDWSTIANTAGAQNNYSSSACFASMTGPDVVLYRDVEVGAAITFILQGIGNRLTVAIGGTCPGTTSLACTPMGGGYLELGAYVQEINFDNVFSWTNNGCNTQRLYILASGTSASGGQVYIASYAYTPASGPLCATVDGLAANVTGPNTADVIWNSTCSGNVIVEYGPAGFTPGTGATANGGTVIPVSGTSTSLSGLSMDMAYDVYVRNDCGSGDYGPNGTASTFTIFNGDDCSRVIALSGVSGALEINTTGTNDDLSVCGIGNTGGDLVMSYIVEPGHGIYFASTPAAPYIGQVRIAYGSGCPGTIELYCASGSVDYLWLNETGVEETVYFIQDGADEGVSTVEWIYFPECALSDTDNDGINDCDDFCINFPGQVGDPCMNGGTPGTISADCQCVTTCTGNKVVVTINTDNDSAQLSWAITDANNAVIATGGPGAGQENTQVSDTVCLGTMPESICYGFKVTDSFGDGITGGGWELRTTDGKTILKDTFSGGAVSPANPPVTATYGSGHPFCLPLGTASLKSNECGLFNNTLNSRVYANVVPGATQYEFQFLDPDAGYVRSVVKGGNSVLFIDFGGPVNALVPGNKYFVRVRTDAGGPLAAANYGPGCEMGLASVGVVRCTQLINAPAYGHSCNETRAFGSSASSFIYATPVLGANAYTFHIYIPGEPTALDTTITRGTYILQLKWPGRPMANGSTYNVDVKTTVNGIQSNYCLPYCTISINNSYTGLINEFAPMEDLFSGDVQLWPNPVADGRVNLAMNGLVDADQRIGLELYDMFGKKVLAREYGNSGSSFSTVLELPSEVSSGVYLVNLTVNGVTTVQRLSVVR